MAGQQSCRQIWRQPRAGLHGEISRFRPDQKGSEESEAPELMTGPASRPEPPERNTEPAAASAPAEKTPLPPVPDHEILCRIGGGSYGEVWLARNVMGTYRAVKVVSRMKFDDERPFEREFA